MPNGIKDYYNLVQMPWGKMFYDIAYKQLNISNDTRLKILDFGSGFGVTANYYAKNHNVIAIEPNQEMINMSFNENTYTLIKGDVKILKQFDDEFDVVICHNVLEYAPNQKEIFSQLVRVLKPKGKLSIIKHNTLGRAMAAAVFDDNPQAALDLISDNINKEKSSTFGNRNLYTNDQIIAWTNENDIKLSQVLGIRAFFGITKNNNIKFGEKWYDKMLELEMLASCMDEFKAIAFFNHLIFEKK
ncbi:methyltransferase domain-containing protein [Paludicola sp. MB14-C6]|uniref:class I SAM-dependent methyltransferase n=1 Tax=Paludihabitans sp. MB14-C6 TaxID=3070656 RepID=UPI0027DB7E6D|nr:class I SAM-dependent methyltransferase [Paludicola sp. MB14-C6]WMJ23194.1 methyltransferase domain-containing protein [Paludicola sp. MB14-C6]